MPVLCKAITAWFGGPMLCNSEVAAVCSVMHQTVIRNIEWHMHITSQRVTKVQGTLVQLLSGGLLLLVAIWSCGSPHLPTSPYIDTQCSQGVPGYNSLQQKMTIIRGLTPHDRFVTAR
eukprot:GHRR01036627.1.p1 GENE.GHRR01036627.1~~GHRR01036627.1.p1  ORF type:complete len:118 (+),score=13.00 GHRR01036627.1:372-725(+)